MAPKLLKYLARRFYKQRYQPAVSLHSSHNAFLKYQLIFLNQLENILQPDLQQVANQSFDKKFPDMIVSKILKNYIVLERLAS